MTIVGDASKDRIFATLIDNIIAIALGYVFLAFVPESQPTMRLLALVVGYLLYFFILEGVWGRTVGKYFYGLVIRKLDGTHPGWRETSIRTIFRIIDINPLLFGALPAGLAVLFSQRKQRFGDMAANTIVVSDKLVWDAGEVGSKS